MKFCMQCGHELGASRTCAECGTTAPVEPLPAPQLPPSGARYPLFADEVDSVSVTTSGRVLAEPVPDPSVPTEVQLRAVPVTAGRSGRPVLWLTLAGLVAAALVLGGWLVLRGGSAEPRSDVPSAQAAPGAQQGSRTGSRTAPGGAVEATASAPVTRAPGVDTAGRRTSYAASNMLDGRAGTAWEMPGDGTGRVLTFDLAGRTHLTEVGLINGYAKTAEVGGRKVDWYAGNRRVLEVEWLFDDGTSVRQDLARTRRPQTVEVDVDTSTVRLRIVEVSAPGTGRTGRDMTPISEVLLAG